MPNHIKSWIPSILLIFIGTLYWKLTLTISSDYAQENLIAINALFFGATFYQPFKKLLQSEFYLTGIRSVSILSLLFFAWNLLFRYFSANTDFKGNIFRGVFNNFQSPTYFHFPPAAAYSWPILFSTAAFFGFVIWKRQRFEKRFSNTQLIPLALIVIIGFTWSSNLLQTFLSTNCHYGTFSEDINKFSGITSLFTNYVGEMSGMSVHNNHYPPGILFLLKIEQGYIPYLLKSLVIVATVASLITVEKLCIYFNSNTLTINVARLLLISNSGILLFPELATDPLTLPLSVLSFYFIYRSVKENSIKYALLFSLMFSFYLFITFSAILFLTFTGLYILILIGFKQLQLPNALKAGTAGLAGIIAAFILLKICTGFSLYDCFIEGLANEKKQMSYEAIDSFSRYLIISSGNIIAYLLILGSPVIAVFTFGIHRLRTVLNQEIHLLGITLILTVLCLGFSSHFFLETERIWIFLSPFVLIYMASVLSELYKSNTKIVIAIILLGMAISLVLRANLTQCLS